MWEIKKKKWNEFLKLEVLTISSNESKSYKPINKHFIFPYTIQVFLLFPFKSFLVKESYSFDRALGLNSCAKQVLSYTTK